MTSQGVAGPHGRSLRRFAVIVVGLAVSAICVWLALRGVDLDRTREVLGGADIRPLLVVGLLIVLQVVVRSVRWSLLLPVSAAGRRIRTRRLIPLVLIGYLGNTVLPARLGDGVRAFLVGRREGIATSSALGSVVLERAIDTLTLALVAVGAAIVSGAPDWILSIAIAAAAIAAAIVGGAQTPIPTRVISGLQARFGRAPRAALWLNRADRFVATMDTTGRRRAAVAAVGLSTFAWLVDGALYWSAGQALGIGLSPAAAMLVSAVTVLGTAIPAAPGYVGTFELAASTTARTFGVEPGAALALAVLIHALTVLPVAIAGFVSLMSLGVSFRTASAAGASITTDPVEPVRR